MSSFVAPCQAGCPAGVNVPGYLGLAAAGRFDDAVSLIRRDNPFPSACASLCTHPCEARCNRRYIDEAVSIRAVKRAVVARSTTQSEVFAPKPLCGKNVAVIGGGAFWIN